VLDGNLRRPPLERSSKGYKKAQRSVTSVGSHDLCWTWKRQHIENRVIPQQFCSVSKSALSLDEYFVCVWRLIREAIEYAAHFRHRLGIYEQGFFCSAHAVTTVRCPYRI